MQSKLFIRNKILHINDMRVIIKLGFKPSYEKINANSDI